MQHAGIELGPHRYDATLQTSTLTCHKTANSAHTTLHNTRARERSRRGTLSKMASFIVDSCRDQIFSLETWDGSKNDRLVSMHTSDHRRSVWYKIRGFTLSCEALGRLLKKKKKNNDDEKCV